MMTSRRRRAHACTSIIGTSPATPRTRTAAAAVVIGTLTMTAALATPASGFQPLLVHVSPAKNRLTEIIPARLSTAAWPSAATLTTTTTTMRRRRTNTHLQAAPSPLPDTTDPFVLLGLDPNNPTADKKEIKRAYKRQAMRYHPDVVISTDSSPEERRRASEEFAKVNAAYEILSGKGSGGAGVGAGKSGAGSRADKGGSGSWAYQPPHRRSGASSSSPYSASGSSSSSSGYGSGASTDWRDYMPNYDEEDAKYDSGDDSLSKIFSDLMTGVAAGAAGAAMGAGSSAGGGGILKDLIDFLEGNVADGGGFGGVNEDDSALSELLIFGSLDEVSNEMDDTQLLVTQLETKIDNMEKDTVMLKEEVRRSMYEYSKYTEKIEIEERLAEVEARKGIVSKYLKKARKRLVKLQARYKELIVEGRSDSRAGTGGYYSGSSTSRSSSGSSSRSSTYADRPSSPPPSPFSDGPTGRSTTSSTASDDSESASFSRTEGFGSFGRRGGSGTRGRSRRNRTRSSDSQSAPSPPPSPSPSYRSSSPPPSPPPASYRPPATSTSRSTSSTTSPSSTRQSSSITTNKEWTPPVPPHRRTGPDPRQTADDKKRLRDIKVDEDFQELKREMGL